MQLGRDALQPLFTYKRSQSEPGSSSKALYMQMLNEREGKSKQKKEI